MKKFLVCAKKIENQLNSSNHDDYFYKSLKIIKEGFNINAFLFGIFWTLYKSLWYESLLIFTLYTIIISLNNNFIFFNDITCFISTLLFSMYIGISASDWEISKIKNKYQLIEIIYAKSKNHALYRLHNAYKVHTQEMEISNYGQQNTNFNF